MKLELRKFKAWLAAKPADEIVGRNRECCACPIARFHKEIGGSEIVIGDSGDGMSIDRGDGERKLPWWAEQFVMYVDDEKNPNITAACALEIIAQHIDT